MRCLFTSICLLVCAAAYAQDFDWWAKKHNWDGHSHWTRYLTLTQKYMGPNALPVPEIKTGNLPREMLLGAFAEAHISKGDKTWNQLSALYVPLSPRVGAELRVVPLEFYRMDTLTRDIRAIRDKDGQGRAGGDIYLGTFIQVLEESERRPGILLTINLKTASGTNLQAARYTDTPGYFMDVSVGKDLKKSSRCEHRVFAQAGFLSYQTYDPDHAQNDAFTYGLGYSLKLPKLEMNAVYGGYIGYLNNGDRPMITRFQLKTRKTAGINYLLQVQNGIMQYQYVSVRLGINWIVPLSF